MKTENAMEQIVLVRPNMKYAWQVMEFKSEMLQAHESFDDCAGLEECSSFDEWLQFQLKQQRKKEKHRGH